MNNFKFGKVKPNLDLDKLPPTGKVTYRSPWLTGKIATADLYVGNQEYSKEHKAIAKEYWTKQTKENV